MASQRNMGLGSRRWKWLTGAALVVGALSVMAFTAAPEGATLPDQAQVQSTRFTTYAGCNTYTVHSGDWLSRIAARYGMSWQRLASMNGLRNPNMIFPGQRLQTCGVANTSHAAATGASTSHSNGVISANTAGEFCHSSTYVAGPISQWAVPPGCYAGIYRPNPANYVYRAGFGWCNWWAEVLHPNDPNILHRARSYAPAAGAVIVFAPGVQGAGSAGHYGEVVAVLGNGWMLISEMNDTWRGAGFGLVNYRYVHTGPGVSFIY